MQVFKTAAALQDFIHQAKTNNSTLKIGFVPTMGALHEGHISLISLAKSRSDLVICSVFVNPAQFNDPKDLERYPRTLNEDLAQLENSGCHVVYTPSVEDVYPEGLNAPYEIDFKGLDQGMEGAFRPGHFKGVARVVERLFRIVTPDEAFFGRKDFQQVAIIKHLVEERNLPVKIVIAETLRSPEGLALSSRNTLLSEDQLNDALIIFRTLSLAKELSAKNPKAAVLKEQLVNFFNTGNLELEYLEIVDDKTLMPVKRITQGCTCCIAAYCGRVRLIDNIALL